MSLFSVFEVCGKLRYRYIIFLVYWLLPSALLQNKIDCIEATHVPYDTAYSLYYKCNNIAEFVSTLLDAL